MAVVVGQDGRVHDVRLLKNSSPEFATRAIEEVKNLKYKAAAAPDGTPVAVRFQMEFAVVELEITVAADGSVAEARVTHSPSKVFSDRSLDTVRKWRLKPATGPAGKPVAVKVPVEITFRLFR